jgi:NEDD8-activating enzyme E1 regulatory subunit
MRRKHDGKPPQTYAEKQEFKKIVTGMKKKPDEENWDEAESQAYRCWTESVVRFSFSSAFIFSSTLTLGSTRNSLSFAS